MAQDAAQLPISRYFRLARVAGGVYAAITVPGTGAWGNAGIVELGDATLVVDTFMTPSAARDLRAAAETLMARPVGYGVNTHYHADHVLGNQVFADALLIATEQTRALIAVRSGRLVAAVKADLEGKELDALEREAQAEVDAALRADLLNTVGEYRALAGDVAALELRLPDVTFADHLILHGAGRSAQVISYGGGHTPSDAFVYLPEARVVFTGDLLSVRSHPSFYGDPRAWIRILSQIEALDIEVAVPGHGPVGGKGDLVRMRQYIADLLDLAAKTVAAGGTKEQATAVPMPDAYQGWAAPSVFRENMGTLYDHAASSGGASHG
jgi:glyoxylase-like metal-dependent hydrolase (beta-lactamase superfamily II)